MPKITRTFIKGKMNKDVDKRVIPDGEYIEANNISIDSRGIVKKLKGNTQLTSLKYIDGTPLSESARTIGSIADSEKETIYWFVHDPNFSIGNTGKLDMIVSFNKSSNTLTYHIISIDDGSGKKTTLNFNEKYLITGIDIIDNLIFFTDYYEQPRFFNRLKNYPNPVNNIDSFTYESLLVIKKPPLRAPDIKLITTGQQDNFMADRFICFAYRYKYENGEYSATSQWTEPAFMPKPFEFSINSFLNEGMVNNNNAAIITYNTGGSLVVGIDLLFKEASSNIIKIIDKLDKSNLGLADNTEYTYVFDNSKIFTILPESELLRLYDNVPLRAMAQTIMGNRLVYGNYIEGYDLVDNDGNNIKLEYTTKLESTLVDYIKIQDSTATGSYSFDTNIDIDNSIVYIDLNGVELKYGSSITIEVTLNHSTFTGDASPPVEKSENIKLTITFVLPKDYASVYEMASSIEFISVIGTVSNIQPVSNSCEGTTFTDQFNCALPNNLDALIKYQSGITAANQPVSIITSPASKSIGFQFPAMRYVNDIALPTTSSYEYYEATYVEAYFQKINSPKSLHSNRGYEIGIIYMDDFSRSTIALVSSNNTVHVPCSASDTQNKIIVNIPETQKPPYWASRYKFVIKPDRDEYDTIYSSIFFNDPLSNNAYFLLEGENSRKIENGDRLIVKADTNGATNSCVYATVLEKESKEEGFIKIPSVEDPNVDIPVPSGVYMKINPNNFSVVQSETSIIAPGNVQVDQNDAGEYPILNYPMNMYDEATETWVDYSVPAGSRIKINFKFQRKGTGDGNSACERRIYTLEKTLISSANYDNMKEWWDGDNVEQILNDGIQDIGAGQCDADNEYIPTLASSPVDIPTELCTNYYRFYRYPTVAGDANSNKLVLIISGTLRCSGLFSGDKRRSTVIANIEVFRSEKTLIFETEPKNAMPDIFFENGLSLPIINGYHNGNIQNQTSGQPAIIDTGFFNCFCFGNGAESYKIRDSIIGKTFNLGNRVTTVSEKEYKQTDRFADITYSGEYNFESNINKLNEFNAGLLNYKKLEVSFGHIYILDGRETDILVLQEDKISYVLAGKNLLSDASAGGAITSVPEVLGTQIARVENHGISYNPESYVHRGYHRYFTDVKRGAVLQLTGNSYNSDQLVVVSDKGMRTWFRDELTKNINTQKIGGFDPYINNYVLTINSKELPTQQACLPCGISQTLAIKANVSVSYCVSYPPAIGESIVYYNSTGRAIIDVTYNDITNTTGIVTGEGSIHIIKNSNILNDINITITAIDDITISINADCPEIQLLTIVSVTLTNAPDAGKFIHNEYRYTKDSYISPLQSSLITFMQSDQSPVISSYTRVTGAVGSSNFPMADAIMEMRSNKFGFDDYNFRDGNKFMFLRSDTLYQNNISDISMLIAEATAITPTGVDNLHTGTFIVPSDGNYLYLIWDYRSSTPVELCYSNIDEQDACCGCT